MGSHSAVGASTGSPAPSVHRHTSHHTHHPLSARLPPPHKLRRLPPTSARQTRGKRKKEKTSAAPSEGTPPIQEERGAGVEEDEEEEEEEEEGESEAEPVEPPPSGSPQKAKVGVCPRRRVAAGGGVRRGGEPAADGAWAGLGSGLGAELGQGPRGPGLSTVLVCLQFSIGSDEDDSPGHSVRAATFTKPLPPGDPRSDKSPQHLVRYWPLAQPRGGPGLLLESVSSSNPKEEGRGRGGRGGGVQTIDEEERTRGPSGRGGVKAKRRTGIERKGQEGGGELPSLPRRSLCLVLRGPLQALPQAERKGTP